VFQAGRTIGSYRIVQKIGTGGMGAVYLAEHPVLTGKRVALKVIHHDLVTNGDIVKRFFQEAQAVNRIGHEHIIEIHDFGVTDDGDQFYIMEYLDGRTLAALMAAEPLLEVARAKKIAAQIAAALEAAHAAGVIHRDLKPDNIMLTPRRGDDDFVKVLDFGLAKLFASESMVQTAHGVLLGTPQYMSPEACEGKRAVDHRTDIYAVGVLLYQMLTAQLPFDGDSMGEVLIKQVSTAPPAPRSLNPNLPAALEQVVLRCLAKQPELRYQSMNELRDALLEPDEERTAVTAVPTANASLVAAAAQLAAAARPVAGGAVTATATASAVMQAQAQAQADLTDRQPPVSAAMAAVTTPVGDAGDTADQRLDSDSDGDGDRDGDGDGDDDDVARVTAERRSPRASSAFATPTAVQVVAAPSDDDEASGVLATTAVRTRTPPTTIAAPVTATAGPEVDTPRVPVASLPAAVRSSAPGIPNPSAAARGGNVVFGAGGGSGGGVSDPQAETLVAGSSAAPNAATIASASVRIATKAAVIAASRNASVGRGAAPLAAARDTAGRRAGKRTRARWPFVLLFGLLLGVGSGAVALLWFGDRGKDAEGDVPIDAASAVVQVGSAGSAGSAGSGSAAAAAVGSGSDLLSGSAGSGSAGSGSAGSGSAGSATTPATALIDLASTPTGATVIGPDGSRLGTTPLTIPWPIADDAVSFDFELTGYITKLQSVVVSGATSIHVELEKDKKRRPRPRPHPRSPPSTNGSGSGAF
jgi:serine/threonine-protein kinase